MYTVLAYYAFVTLDDPHREVAKHKAFFEDRDVSGRIYLSEEGVNGQMSASPADAEAFISWLHAQPLFASVSFKKHLHHENIFPRMTVKYRKQLVALDCPADLAHGGEHLSPAKWAQMLESEDVLLLDVRNDYESKIGHFEGAVCPPLKTFRDFPAYADKLSKEVDSKKKVMMYCTGGIRCELYSALLKEKGFEQVYQLDGGVINYGLQEGSKHWKGKLFVFDDRLAVPIDGEEVQPITLCVHCDAPSDRYLNCANMECNELFLCCDPCQQELRGCCSPACTEAPRVRPPSNKPFRRKHLISSECRECALESPTSPPSVPA